jgi:enterochelin esterase-like enzyme
VGRQEDIYPLSGMFHAACRSRGVQADYHEEDGNHDWFSWDGQIRRFLAAVLGPMPAI